MKHPPQWDLYRLPLTPRRSNDGCLLRVLFVLILVGVALSLLLTYRPDGPQFFPWLEHQLLGPLPTPQTQTHTQPPISHATVTGGPSLSVAFVNQVLEAAQSPAQGTGQALYDFSKQYQIDDAYALAFFKAESQYGTTGQARVTRSLGNIRCAGYSSCLNGYRAYASWQQGYQAWYELIRTLYVNQWHLTTIDQIIPVYAPKGDGNDPPAYIATVKSLVTQWQQGVQA